MIQIAEEVEYHTWLTNGDGREGVFSGEGLQGLSRGRIYEIAEITLERMMVYGRVHTNACLLAAQPHCIQCQHSQTHQSQTLGLIRS